ncbi:MAG: ABC transporter ATP-binding protein [Calditrichaeota bacterium]|nr:MAG: ABC transporter ATP-binding protein [Calditrichota bacterium]
MVKVIDLEKQFGKLQVLKGIHLTFETGQVTAVVGPNGSGKTTLIKSILGLVKPDRGHVLVKGVSLNGNWEYRKWIGYMPQYAHFPENLRVQEILYMIKDLHNGEAKRFDEELYEKFALEKELRKPIRTLSGGTRQKVSAILTFLFDPDILILDEPTAGLDPVSSSILKDKIIKEKQKGKTIILTSHIMSEVEEMADQIVFLLEGKIYFQGPVATLKQNIGERNLERSIARMMEQGASQ